MAKKFYENKELNKECEDVKNEKLMYKFKKKRTGHDVNREKRAKKEREDEIKAHIESHQGQVREGLQYIMEGWKLLYIHPQKRYMTLHHPDSEYKKFNVNGADNVTEIEGWISQYGFNYAIFLPGKKGGNTVLPADFRERFGK